MQSKADISLDILIVGAGLSGLAAAIAIASSGHNVTVIESARELREIGAGLQVTPNSSKILERWGVLDRMKDVVAEPTSLTVHRYSGKVLAHEPNFSKKIRARYRTPFIDVHRFDLQHYLYLRAKELGVRFKLGERVAEVNMDIPDVITESGLHFNADLIVAADGLWSACRTSFLGKKDAPQPTGDLAFRVVLELDEISDPELKDWVSNPTVHFWIGPGCHAVGYSLRAGKQYNLVLLVPDDLPDGVSKLSGSVEEMKQLFHGWDPVLNQFLSMVDQVEKWKLMHIDELPSWINENYNLVFVGDACHPMLPYLAQGANSAVEDGAVLGLLLGHISSKDQLPEILRLYERLRKQRGDSIVKEAFKQRDDFHLPDGPAQEARDRIFLSQLGKELKGPFPSRWTCPVVQPWLYGYDAFEEVEKALKAEPISKQN